MCLWRAGGGGFNPELPRPGHALELIELKSCYWVSKQTNVSKTFIITYWLCIYGQYLCGEVSYLEFGVFIKYRIRND